jgi:type IV secretory pathway TrbD component
MATLGYLCWNLAQVGVTLFAVSMAILVVIIPTALADPHLVRYIQRVIYVIGTMYFIGFIIKAFFPVPADYKGIFD